MYTFPNGDQVPERKYIDFVVNETMTTLRAYCCNYKTEFFTRDWFGRPIREKNIYNYKDIIPVENSIYVGAKRYDPVFEFLKYKDTKTRVPVFWEDMHTLARDERILHDKYYDLALHCGELVILCEDPAWGMVDDKTLLKSSYEVLDEICSILDKICNKIKSSGIEHGPISIMVIDIENICDDEGFPKAEVYKIMAKNPKPERKPLPAKMTISIKLKVDPQKITQQIFQKSRFFDEWHEVKFSVDKKRHYSICVDHHGKYENGIITFNADLLEYGQDKYLPLRRYLQCHDPKEVIVTSPPKWESRNDYGEFGPSDGIFFSKIIEDEGTEIISMAIDYDKKHFTIK